jgi:ABC-type transport system substrate-binding protein
MTDTDNLSRRRFLQGTGAAATAAALAGCTGDGDGDDDTDETTSDEGSGEGEATKPGEEVDVDPSKRVRALNGGTMDTLDPIASTDTTSGRNVADIFDALINYPNGQTNVQNLLASEVETSNDGSTMTITLKEGATFSNGDEVTAADVVYSFERLAASDNSRRTSFILNTLGVDHETTTVTQENDEGEEEEVEVYEPGTLDIETDGDYTVTLNLQQPFYAATSMLAYSSFAIVPEGIVGDIEGYDGQLGYEEFATENPVGAGPYVLNTWQQASEVTLDARDDYHGGEIRNAGIDRAVFNETNPRYTYATVNVNADSPYIPTAQYDPELRSFEGTDDRNRRYGTYGPMDNDLTAKYYEVATLSTYYVGFNVQNVPKPVRQAVAYTISQQTFVNNIYPAPAQQAYNFTPPSIFPNGPENYKATAEEYKYGYRTGPQLDKATQVMEDAGYGPDNRFSMAFNMGSSTASSWGSDFFTLMRDQLTQAYIDIELETADWNAYLNQGRQGDFDMYFLGWIADYPGADNFLNLAYPPATNTSSSDAPIGYINWRGENATAAGQASDGWEMIQNNYASGQQEGRAEGGMMMENAIEEDAVYVPLIHGITQGMDYGWVDSPRVGAMGGSRSKSNSVGIGDRGPYE